MGNPRGVKRDFVALEARRLRAARMFQQGESQAEIARVLGVHRQTVHRWSKQVEQEGRAALKKAGRAGRKPRLGTAELQRIGQELKRGPQVLGYETSLWTAPRVADLIERECGIRYHPGHVWKILRQMGWSCQRPVGRALERNEPSIRRWKKQRWPELKKKPKKKGESSSSSMKAD
jgi:transposase